MLNQIFKTQVNIQILFEFLEKFCIKTDKYYLVDMNAYRKMIYYGFYDAFITQIVDNYHLSKQFYVTRKVTYNSFTNIIRQICKSNNIMFTSQIKYNESKYNIDYMIYTENLRFPRTPPPFTWEHTTGNILQGHITGEP